MGVVAMAQEHPNRLVEWLVVARKQWPILREHFENWLDDVRGEPRLIWETSAVRYATYGLSALVLVWVVTAMVGWITPPPPASARPAATTADFHVVCADPQCARHFVIHREFGFREFPVGCPACQRTSGVPARRCNSATCAGRWVAPENTEGAWRCPICGNPWP